MTSSATITQRPGESMVSFQERQRIHNIRQKIAQQREKELEKIQREQIWKNTVKSLSARKEKFQGIL